MSDASSVLAIALLIAVLVIDRPARWQGALVTAVQTVPAATGHFPEGRPPMRQAFWPHTRVAMPVA